MNIESNPEWESYYLSLLEKMKVEAAPGRFTDSNSQPLRPIMIEEFHKLSSDERNKIKNSYSEDGIAYVICKDYKKESIDGQHPLLHLAGQLHKDLPLSYPIIHPMESHSVAKKVFGREDGTLKIYNLPVKKRVDEYVEQVETTKDFLSHTDGLGFGGKVESFMLFSDSSPSWGGYTFFQNLFSVGLELYHQDKEAFLSTLNPNALVSLRPRGKGAIQVKSPIFYLNDNEKPKAFFRVSTGEYTISWDKKNKALCRAIEFLNEYAKPFSKESKFVNFSAPGHCVIVNNSMMIHGRTEFINTENNQRVLARKWFMEERKFTQYLHIPKMYVSSRLLNLYPDYAVDGELCGEWHYSEGVNRALEA